MPLSTHRNANAFTDPGTAALVFHMLDPEFERPIRVTVQPEAILKLGGGANPVSAFELNRAKIESIASEKFDKQVGVEVVLRAEDILD